MNDTGVIDNFLTVFSTYIDSGFGLLGGEVGFLSSTLIVIDVTIAALFWAWGTDEDVLQRLIKKTLYIGVFAFIIGNFQTLSIILLESFAGLGLKASGGAMAIGDFMRPGMIAATGLDAAQPLLDATADLVGPVGLFTNFIQIMILLIAWMIVVIAFFILAVQVFVTILEFKLVTLAGFVLLPFAFFNRTAFMAERVLGHVVSSGIKLLVLAVITGIGVTLFERFMQAGIGADPDIREVMAIALGALTLLGLGIFGPNVASGIVAGGPQLGAGAAVGTVMAAGGVAAGGVAAVGAARSLAVAGGRISASAAGGGARVAGTMTAAYRSGSVGRSGASAVAGGFASAGKAALSGAGQITTSPLRKAAERLKLEYQHGASRGSGSAPTGNSGSPVASPSPSGSETASPGEAPAWAKAMRQRMLMKNALKTTAQVVRGSDGHGSGASVDLSEKD